MLFKCKNCGGNTVYAPEKGTMCCPHCESLDSEEVVTNRSLVECPNCGAPNEIDQNTSASSCKHCGSYLVYEERIEGEYQPHLILPFKVSKKQAIDAMKTEFKKRAFTPASFLSESTLMDMQGAYVPFWLYDYETNYDFAGQGTKVRVWTTGDTEYTETSFYEIERNMEIKFEQIPCDASEAMEDGIMDLLEPFQYQALEAFQAKFMSGFMGERYNFPAEELEPRVKEKVKKDADMLLDGTINGYATVTTARRDLVMDRVKTNYALLPVWVYVYRYRGKEYKYHVNGQTGKVIGITPVSKGMVFGYGATVFASIFLLATMINTILGVF